MRSKYARRLVAGYVRNLIRGQPYRRDAATAILEWAVGDGDAATRGRTWAHVYEALDEIERDGRSARPGPVERNLRGLARYLGLDSLETRLLELACCYQRFRDFETLCDELQAIAGRHDSLIAALLGISERELMSRERRGMRMVECGLLEIESHRTLLRVDDIVVKAIETASSTAEVGERLLGEVQPSALGWDDFVHLGPARDLAAQVLAGALRSGEHGVNLLLYGPVGTGKTEFARVLAAHLGAVLYGVGERDRAGEEPSRGERMGALRLTQQLLAARRDALILFDEMEDWAPVMTGELFGGGIFGRGRGSKVYLNRALEKNPVPVIWTANEAHRFDPALLRRMSFVIEMRRPSVAVRARVWQRVLDQQQVAVSPELAGELAHEFPIAPALAASAARAVRLAGGDDAKLRLAVRNLARAVAGSLPAPESGAGEHYRPDLVNADADLGALTARMVETGQPAALCLYGPSGTGKSAYARYLAAALGREVLFRRASDLLSKWVGGTEANLAGMFEEARDTGAFLIVDEADSFLRERAGAAHSWEVTQVNELLTWLEHHPLPCAFTTNLMDVVDSAALRRFTFKIRFDSLRADQRCAAFRHFFGLDVPAGVSLPGPLTPGDFAVVARQAPLLGIAGDPLALCTALATEAMARKRGGRAIGFTAD